MDSTLQATPATVDLGRRQPSQPLVVIDTNVVLDLWWFEDPRSAALAQALAGGQLRWLVTEAMQVELHDVLGRAAFARHPTRCERVRALSDRLSELTDAAPAQPNIRCTDPDDQIFVDLAAAHRAAWLFSRDRALLDLAPRLLGCGCVVLEPGHWRPGALTSAVGPNP